MSDVARMKHVGGPVPAEQAERLKEIADENERSVSAELRLAIREHIDRNDAAETVEARTA